MSKYLQQWREAVEATEEIQLSVGPAVIRTYVRVRDLAAAGSIPTTLVLELEGIGKKIGDDLSKIPEGAMTKLGIVLDAVAIAAFVDPPLAEAADDEHLAASSIPFTDRLTVFYRLNREVEPLREFREEPGQPDRDTPAGDDLPLPAVGDSGDSG